MNNFNLFYSYLKFKINDLNFFIIIIDIIVTICN